MMIRKPIVGGIFYPDERDELSVYLQDLFDRAPHRHAGEQQNNIGGIVVPHAAYEYIGPCAAGAYAAARQKTVKQILLMGPLHRERKNQILLSGHTAFASPLGELKINGELTEALAEQCEAAEINSIPHEEEHCLEVQLPFIKYLFPEAEILPVLTGRLTKKTVRQLAKAVLQSYSQCTDSLLMIITVNTPTAAESLNVLFTPGNSEAFFQENIQKGKGPCGPECLGFLLYPDFGFNRIEKESNLRTEAFTYSSYSLYTE